MYISLKWIQDLVGIQNLSLDDLINRLILAGFEIESITNRKLFEQQDFILDISFTANRTDVTNMKGLSLELLALFGSNIPLKIPYHTKPLIILSPHKNSAEKIQKISSSRILLGRLDFIIFFLNYKLYLFEHSVWEHYLQKTTSLFSLTIPGTNYRVSSNNKTILFNVRSQNLRVSESPRWIKKRLLAMDLKPINNVIDILNYLLIETGQIFFAYDVGKITSLKSQEYDNMNLTYASEKSSFPIEESKTINLNPKALVINAGSEMIAIVGLLQKFNTLVTKETSKMIIQTGFYDTTQIKTSSKTLNLRTDYSMRLEKQVDLNLLEQSYIRLKNLFWSQKIELKNLLISPTTLCTLNAKSPLLVKYILSYNRGIRIFYNNVNKLLGPYKQFKTFTPLQVRENLKLLNFKVSLNTSTSCYVLIPLSRKLDLERETDLIEEVARIGGFDKFMPILPKSNYLGQLTKLEKCKRLLRNHFLKLGFNETMHSTLILNNSTYQSRLKNPLANEISNLRTSLLPGLIDKLKLNQNNVGKSFEAFEIGRVYKSPSVGCIHELEFISGIFGGKRYRSTWDTSNSDINWFEAKGRLEDIFHKLSISPQWNKINLKRTTGFHPNRTVSLSIGKDILGIFGQIHPNLEFTDNFSKKTYLFELNLEVINKFWKRKTFIHFNPFSSFPSSSVTLSCLVKKDLSFAKIKQQISLIGQPLLNNIILSDYYSNFPIKKGYCNLNFKLEFQSKRKTLLNSEVEEIVHSIKVRLRKDFDIKFQ
nr:phenylalanyl tRNA synthetase beta subunit [Ishige okamurae]